MSRELAEKAYNAIKEKEDPEFNATTQTFQNERTFAAESVVNTGVAFSDFEKKVKELSDNEKAGGKTEAKATEPKAPEKTDDGGGEQLDKLTRAELDDIAETEFGFNPSDYSNKAEIVKAIEEARAK